MSETLPVRPYVQEGERSAGYSVGADTSKDAEPTRAGAQVEVLAILAVRGYYGLTGHEANEALGKPHMTTGQSSLSTLHLAGKVMRLALVRDRQKVYVLPEFVGGREIEGRGRHGLTVCPHCGGSLKQREGKYAMEFSEETIGKAHQLLEEGLVDTDEEFENIWWVTSLSDADNRYRVQADYNPTTRTISWITCTCPHGLNVGAGATRCYHAAAVLIRLKENQVLTGDVDE